MDTFISRVRRFWLRKRESALLSRPIKADKSKVLLVKLDKLGDYILFRNFIEEAHRHYKQGEIILCGNIAWKELSEKLDAEFVEAFIWVAPSRLEDDSYRLSVYKKIRKAGCDKVMHCSYSRALWVDNIVLRSGAKEIITFYGDETNMPGTVKKENDAKYTLLVPSPAECMFEFDRNKLFFEYIFQERLEINKPFIKTVKSATQNQVPYIVIFPGAGHAARRWAPSNFAALCNSLFQLYKLPIYVCGAENELGLAKDIIALSGSFVINKIGAYSLPEMTEVIREASLVITNDSGPLHLAMAVNTPTICISNGNHFERFCPYPRDMNMPLNVVFPDEFEAKIKDETMVRSLRCKGSDIDINLIGPDKVFNSIKSSNFIKYA